MESKTPSLKILKKARPSKKFNDHTTENSSAVKISEGINIEPVFQNATNFTADEKKRH